MRLARFVPAILGALIGACSSKPLGQGGAGGADGAGGAGSGGAPVTREITVFDRVRISSDAEAEFTRQADAPIDFGAETVARATLRVELESPCFPFDTWSEETVPAGQNWPTFCDAFDRSFSLSLDDDDPPGLELVRAITPFGGPLSFDLDVTDVVNGALGDHTLRVDIQTYGDPDGVVSGTHGEWIVSVHLELEAGAAPRRVLALIPLVFGVETAAAPPPLAFDVPEGAGSARLEYRVTGHGGGARGDGCIGPAEEFCERTHTLYLDGGVIDEFSAWRDDCASLCTLTSYESDFLSISSYCAENPCGLPSSVRAPRANWCPGSITPPRVVELEALAEPGSREFAFELNQIDEGGSWIVSASYFAFE